MVHLIGSRWLAIRDDGTSRLEDAADFVRFEIEYALEANVRLIPVLVDGAHMPTNDQVPPEIRPFLRKHAHTLDNDHWSYDVEALERLLAKELTGVEDVPAVPSPRPRPALKRVLAGGAALLAAAVAAFLLWPSAPAP